MKPLEKLEWFIQRKLYLSKGLDMEKKVKKTLKRRCPDCGERLLLVSCQDSSGGVKYEATLLFECRSCGYEEICRDYRKGRNKLYDMGEKDI